MEKLALHFGAGNIGRGFIAPVLQENNFRVIFVDIDEKLINKINKEQKYDIRYINSEKETKTIKNIEGISLSDIENLKKLVKECKLVTTSVGPNYVKDVVNTLVDNNSGNNLSFIAFENKYRCSTTTKSECKVDEKNIYFIDAVVDKIIPIQDSELLDVKVEEYGSIILDENHNSPLIESDVVTYGSYEYEFKKKLWMLNGFHVCLAYFGLSKNLKYIHELFTNRDTREFAETISMNYLESISLLGHEEKNKIENYKNTIVDRFSNTEINDELIRVARNPFFKFSKNERFHGPIDLLLKNNRSVDGFSQLLEVLFDYDFSLVDGFSEFKDKVLNLGKTNMYKSYWNQETNIDLYSESLGF